MNPVIGQCPICTHVLKVSQLHCQNCETSIKGHFTLGKLYYLSPDQLDFIELFVRSEGKINRVGQELGLSYPAVRARLTDVIKALGYEAEPDAELTGEDRQDILAQVSVGSLTAVEAAALLRGE